MKHIDALSVLGSDIRTVLDKQPDQGHTAMETCEVEGCEAIVAP